MGERPTALANAQWSVVPQVGSVGHQGMMVREAQAAILFRQSAAPC
jgi:hypothetical protein